MDSNLQWTCSFRWNKNKGLSKHKKTTRNSLPNNLISDICIDNKGSIWIIAGSGIVKFIPEEEKFIDMHSDKYGSLKKLRSSYSVIDIDKKDRLCINNMFTLTNIIIDTRNDSLIRIIDESTMCKQNSIKGDIKLLMVDGFSSLSYFSKCFFDQFKINPKEFSLIK